MVDCVVVHIMIVPQHTLYAPYAHPARHRLDVHLTRQVSVVTDWMCYCLYLILTLFVWASFEKRPLIVS